MELRTLKEWRMLKAMSLQELSERTGLSKQSLLMLENDARILQNVKYSIVKIVTDVLGVTPDNILELTPKNLE